MTDQQKKQVSPMALAVELNALVDFYRNRTLMLADALEHERQENERLTKINGKLQDAAAKADKKGAQNGG